MRGLIQASLFNPYAVVVGALTVAILGSLAILSIPVDILPVFKSPAVQVLTFYGGMPVADVERTITTRMERWVGQVSGVKRLESRSVIGASVVRVYFQDDVDASAALAQVNSFALATLPYLPPGTLPPVVFPFDPTGTTPICLIAMNSNTLPEEKIYDVGRLEVRNLAMQNPGTVAPVVIGGKLRAIIMEVDSTKLQARNLSPLDIMTAVEKFNVFLPGGDVKIGDRDIAIDSNALYPVVERMDDIPIKTEPGKFCFLYEVAKSKDSAFIQTSMVLISDPKGKPNKEVYVPIYRQVGASTLSVVGALKQDLPEIKSKLTESDIDLKVVMDQSIYVRASINALMSEGLIGALLCSLVILLFLGQWRMTIIAILTLPLSVMTSVVCLYLTGQTINVMTLAGLALAIGPMIDSAIICLENTHRHLMGGADPKTAALDGASEVAMPELASTLCTFLVLTPLIFVPGTGRFLFLPMVLSVMFAMTAAYILSRTLVPCASAFLLSSHDVHAQLGPPNAVARFFSRWGWYVGLMHFFANVRSNIAHLFARWEWCIDQGILGYARLLDVVMRHPRKTVAFGFTLLGITLVLLLPRLRRDFFPEVDSGAFEIAARAPSGTKIEITEELIKKVDAVVRKNIPDDLQLIVSEIGLAADWSAAYTPNSGPMDGVLKVQLKAERHKSAQEYIRILRHEFREKAKRDPAFQSLEFSFDSGGLVRGALNEGKSSPLNIQIVGKNQKPLFALADKILQAVKNVRGVADARVLQKPDAPQWRVEVDRTAAADLGLNTDEIMKNLVAATNSSIMYNKRVVWIDPKNGNQYFVGVQFAVKEFATKDDLLDNINITSLAQHKSIPLRNVASIIEEKVPTEIHHVSYQPAIDLTMNVEGRDLGHVSDDVTKILQQFGKRNKDGSWAPYVDHTAKEPKIMEGAKFVLTGEYTRMQETFKHLGIGLLLAVVLMYFLLVCLDRSFLSPLAVLLVVPLSLIGILWMLFFTGSAINMQSMLGFIFIVGIKVANTVLMTDYAQELRRHEGLSPAEAMRKAAILRVRPVTMTALAAFFAMVPTALALETGSEANAPLARAILGGLLAGEPATLFIHPVLYILLVRDEKTPPHEPAEA